MNSRELILRPVGILELMLLGAKNGKLLRFQESQNSLKIKLYWLYWDRAKLLRSNSLNLSLFESQIKVWMIECLVYAC